MPAQKNLSKKQKTIVTVLTLLESLEGLTMLAELGRNHSHFQMLIATILSARAKDEVTLPISKILFQHYGTAQKLACADPNTVKNIIRKIGFYNNKTKTIIATAKRIQTDFHGQVPSTMEELLSLPGVGRKVANCMRVYAFGQKAIPVDTHVHRISNRLGWVTTKTPEDTERALEQCVPKKYWPIVNEAFVKYGKSLCAPISPFCSQCPIQQHCPQIGVTKKR